MATKQAPKTNLPAKSTQKTNLPVAKAPLSDVMAAAGTSGFENVTAADSAIPFLYILQTMSPQVKKGHPSKVPGAEEGMFFNNVTMEVFGGPLKVIPCAFQKSFVEWTPREAGGGFVKQHPDESVLTRCTRNEKNMDVLPNGNHIVPTAYHYVLVVRDDGKMDRVVMSFTRTQLKKSRRWVSQMMSIQLVNSKGQQFRPPMFSHVFEVAAVLEQKDQYSWYGFQVGSPEVIADMAIYREAARFNAEVMGGNVKISVPAEDGTSHVDTSSDHSSM